MNFHTLENIQSKFRKSCQKSADADYKTVFTSFKINNYFSTKDKTPYFSKSFLVHKFVSARCNSSYIGETCRHFKTRIDEHVKKTKNLTYIYINFYTIMKSVSQVLIQIVFLF